MNILRLIVKKGRMEALDYQLRWMEALDCQLRWPTSLVFPKLTSREGIFLAVDVGPWNGFFFCDCPWNGFKVVQICCVYFAAFITLYPHMSIEYVHSYHYFILCFSLINLPRRSQDGHHGRSCFSVLAHQDRSQDGRPSRCCSSVLAHRGLHHTDLAAAVNPDLAAAANTARSDTTAAVEDSIRRDLEAAAPVPAMP